MKQRFLPKLVAAIGLAITAGGLLMMPVAAQTQQQSGGVGVEGKVPADPPTKGATISVPANGQSFTSLPITVSGLCPKGLLVAVFKNDVFGGSVDCATGSYSLQMDLFDGQNNLVAKVYDALNQAGPDSNTVTVTFNSGAAGKGPRISLTTAFSKRGATPGTSLSWPLTLSGGQGPYALNADWGDKTPPDLVSRASAGDFTLAHTYLQSGLYKVTIKATDAATDSAFLQLVGVGNGPIQQTANQGQGGKSGQTQTVIAAWPFLGSIGLIAAAFWVGQKHQLEVIRGRLRKGERPFK